MFRPFRSLDAFRPLFTFAFLAAVPALSAQSAPAVPQPPAPPAAGQANAPAAPAAGRVNAPSAVGAVPTAPAAPAPPPSHAEAMATGRRISQLVMDGDIASLVSAVDPQAAASATDIPSRVAQGVAAVGSSLGGERRMISEQIMIVNGRIEYRRLAEYELVPVPIIFRVILGGTPGTWRSFTLSTEENAPPGDEVKP